jgi:hypothetical protein
VHRGPTRSTCSVRTRRTNGILVSRGARAIGEQLIRAAVLADNG